MATYLQLIEKLSDNEEYFDESTFSFDKGFVTEIFSMLQNLSEEDAQRFEDILNAPDNTLEEDLPARLSLNDLRVIFVIIIILESPSVEQGLALFRKFVQDTGARELLDDAASYHSSYNVSESEQARALESRRKAKFAKLALAKRLITPEVVPYLCCHIKYALSNVSESFAAQIIPDILLGIDKVRLEKVILFWDDMMSKPVRRTLRRVYLDASPNSVERANAMRMLVLLGDAQVIPQ